MHAVIINCPLKHLICPIYSVLLFSLNNLLQVSVYGIIVMKCKNRAGIIRKQWKHKGRRKETEGRYDIKGLDGGPDTTML